jgi:hypothetical protein
MKHLNILFIFISLSCYAQKETIKITLDSNSTITTEWIKLYDFPFFKNPYIQIDGIDGDKIKIKDIRSYIGYDQFGNYRRLETIRFKTKGKYYFTEQTFKQDSTDNSKIFYNQVLFGRPENSSKFNRVRYKLESNEIKDLNYKNVKIDFDYAQTKLKNVNRLKLAQIISASLGVLLLSDIILDHWDPKNAEFGNKKDELKFITSGLLLTFPFTLEKAKQKRLIKIIKNQ